MHGRWFEEVIVLLIENNQIAEPLPKRKTKGFAGQEIQIISG